MNRSWKIGAVLCFLALSGCQVGVGAGGSLAALPAGVEEQKVGVVSINMQSLVDYTALREGDVDISLERVKVSASQIKDRLVNIKLEGQLLKMFSRIELSDSSGHVLAQSISPGPVLYLYFVPQTLREGEVLTFTLSGDVGDTTYASESMSLSGYRIGSTDYRLPVLQKENEND